MNGGMVPCDINSLSDDEGLVTATMSFTDGSTAFDMESHVKLRKSSADDDSVFIRHYGWSIKTLVAPFGDSHAELLDAITLERGSKIAIVDILSTSLTSSGLDAIDRVIKRAPSLPTIRLFLDKLHEEDQLEKAMILLERYKDRLISLRLNGGSKTKWLARITQALPTRDMFPLLEELTIDGQTGSSVFPANCQNWIVSMVSTPPSPLKQLKAFCLSNTYYYWDRIVRTMDLSALEVISFKGCTFFGNSDLVLLAERIVDGESQSRPFRRLDLSDCLFHDPSHCLAVFVMFREKGLLAKVVGLEDHLD
ncbi:hypothetical protein B0O80DRAFT_457534 [Mortierella sp. GBAus27b]|nr:hypothetical protein B0O80DRAFT_457534 [Mortierella sp. GBAus27b]